MERTNVRVLAPPGWSAPTAVWQLGRLREHRELIAVLSRHRINVRYKQSMLGTLWAVLQPVAMMLVFTAVFARLTRIASDGVPYPLFAYAGILSWTFFATAVSNGTTSLVSHAQLVTKVFFPREILPLSYVIAAVCDLAIGAAALVGLVLWFEIDVGWRVLAVVPIVATLGAFALACALTLSTVQVRFRDVGVALPVALQLWMFASPVLYPMSIVPERWRPVYVLNPMAGLVDNFRRAVTGMPLEASSLLPSMVITLLALPAAYVLFKHVDATVADVI